MIVICKERLADPLPWSVAHNEAPQQRPDTKAKAQKIVACLLLLEARIVSGDAFREHVVTISWLEQIQSLLLS